MPATLVRQTMKSNNLTENMGQPQQTDLGKLGIKEYLNYIQFKTCKH